jgi:hypothetical protein
MEGSLPLLLGDQIEGYEEVAHVVGVLDSVLHGYFRERVVLLEFDIDTEDVSPGLPPFE